MRLSIVVLLFLGAAAAYGDDNAITIPGAKASIKGVELILVPAATIDPNEFIVLFRKAHSKEIVGGDCLEQFGGHFSSNALPIKTVVWSPTGEYVAFDLRTERHYTRTIIYRVADGVTEVRVPDYWAHLKTQLGTSAEFSGGQQIPIRWVDDTHLEIKESGALRDDTAFKFRVTLELSGVSAKFQSAKRQ